MKIRKRCVWLWCLLPLTMSVMAGCARTAATSPSAAAATLSATAPGGDAALYAEGLAALPARGTIDADRARNAFTALILNYPKSALRLSAQGYLRLLDEVAKLTPDPAGNGNARLLQACRREKQRLEDRIAESTRIKQENDQLKKDLQMLKQVEIDMQRRPQPYR